MSDDHPQPYDGLTRWLGEGDDEPIMPTSPDAHRPRPRRAVVRLVALALPWLVTLAVLAATAAGGARPAGRDAAATAPPDFATASAPTSPDVATASAPTPAPAPGGGPADERPPDGVAAVAVGAVRDAVTGQRGGSTRALDVAAAEAPRPLGSGHWLVRVRAVVLRGDRQRWHGAAHEVWAVPVTLRGGAPVAADAPWRVATGQPRPPAAAWRAARIDRAAVAAALRRAGARPAADLHAQQHPRLPDVVRVRTTGGGHVWLHTTPAPRVLGADAERAPAERPS